MTYEVRTPVYEGPLELLLQLITSHRLDVTEVSLSELVTEYLAHLGQMREMDLEVTSEFLMIAATLIQLKARRLLPGDDAVDLDEDLLLAEERDRLLARLLANLTFKDVATVLALRFEATEMLVSRQVGLDLEITPPRRELRLGVTALELARLADRILRRSIAQPDLDHLDLELPSVSDAIADLRRRLEADIETDFDRLTAHLERPLELVAYFLAMLELARWGLVEARQTDARSPIVLRRTEGPAGVLISEWDS
jgi:segregation and condensation protein A